MSKQASEEKIVSWGVVLITIGLFVVVTAAAVLLFQPTARATAVAKSPQAVVTVVVTPVSEQAEETAETIEGATEITLPENFVSLNDAPRTSIANQPQRIVIPSIAVDAPISEVGLDSFVSNGQTYYQWQVPDAPEAGWHNTSAPLGQPGNTVLNGHHNVFGKVFGRLVDLELGAEIVVYDRNTAYTYTVTDVQILAERGQPLDVRVQNAQWIQPTNDERLTLVTCWPKNDNSHRLIVVAYPNSAAEDTN